MTFDPTAPFRLRLAQAVTDTIKMVTPANGFTYDLSDFDTGDGSGVLQPRVFRGRPWFGDSDPIPMVSILEAVNPADELVAPALDDAAGEFDWPLLIQGFVNDDPVNPTDPAYWLERDVRRALGKERRRLVDGSRSKQDFFGYRSWAPPGCAVVKMSVGPGVIRPADDVSSKAYFWLVMTLTITEAEAA